MSSTLFRVLLACCLLTAASPLKGQEWVKTEPTFHPPGNYSTYRGCFVDRKHGWWLAAPNNSLLHTSDGGIAWEVIADSVAYELVEFADTVHGWIAGRILPGDIYNLLITKDGGKSWNRYLTPPITSFVFFDSLNGFAGCQDIYRTTDGGVTWEVQTIEPHIGFIGIWDIFFIDKKFGWAVGDGLIFDAGVVLSTTDSGRTWQFNDTLTTVGFAVFFTDTLHGYIVGTNPPFFSGVIRVTQDGGKNWTTRYMPGPWLNDVVFADDSTGWAVGDYGFIWQTTDRGANWTQVPSGTNSHLYRVFFFDNVGFILGADSTLLRYETSVDVTEEDPPLPTKGRLFQNYPNPFNAITSIDFELAEYGLVSLRIHDPLGREVVTLLNEEEGPGIHKVCWNGKDKHGIGVSSGMYFYQLKTNGFRDIRRALFLK